MKPLEVTQRRKVGPTAAGWYLLLVTAACTMAGFWRGDVPMLLVGVATGLCTGLAALRAWRHGAQLAWSLELPRRVEGGRLFPARLQVDNRSRSLDAWDLQVLIHHPLRSTSACWFGHVPARSAMVADIELTIDSRGRLDRVRLGWTSFFPLGLFEVSVTEEPAVEVMVTPRSLVPRGWEAQGLSGRAAGDSSRAGRTAVWGEPKGVRPWRSGDPVKRLDWPATLRSLARGAGWMVREADAPHGSRISYVMVIHSHGSGRALLRPDRFERMLSHAAGLLRRLHGEGCRCRLMADFDNWQSRICSDAAGLRRCLDALATAERSTATEAHELSGVLSGIPSDEGLIVLSDLDALSWWQAVPVVAKRAWTVPTGGAHAGRGVRP